MSLHASPRRHVLQPDWANPDAHRPRFEQMRHCFEGRSVLDVGCASGWRRPDWYHRMIAGVARELVGIDLDGDAVDQIRAAGFDVQPGDATDFDLGRAFDVVHAGELIEHLDNPASFLACAQRHMRPDSELVLTTPNAFCVTNFVYRLGGRARVNAEHVAWYCEDTLRQLLDRNGFEVVELRYLAHRPATRWRRIASGGVRRMLPARLAWNTMLVVARMRSKP